MEERLKDLVGQEISNMTQEGLQMHDVDILGKLVDIHKDLSNEEYWKVKEEALEMRYNDGNYGNYGNYGNDYGNYGRRGVPGSGRGRGRGRYRGNDMMEEMQETYQDYMEGKEAYGRGNYRAKDDTMKSLECMMEAVVDFVGMLENEANSQEEVELIKKYARKIGER